MTDSDKPKRLVKVPIAGYVLVEIDADIEVAESMGWDDPTPFEAAAISAANDALAADKFPHNYDEIFEWSIEAHHRLVSGNILHAECNEISDEGVAD